MNNTRLATPAQVQVYVNLGSNLLDTPNLELAILQAQDKYLQPVIGHVLYEKVKANMSAYTDLLPYLIKPLAYYTEVLLMTMQAIVITEAGVQALTSDYSTSAPEKLMNQKSAAINDSAQQAVTDLVRYLTKEKNEDFLNHTRAAAPIGGWY